MPDGYWDLMMGVHQAIGTHLARSHAAGIGQFENVHYHSEQAGFAWEKSWDFVHYLQYSDQLDEKEWENMTSKSAWK